MQSRLATSVVLGLGLIAACSSSAGNGAGTAGTAGDSDAGASGQGASAGVGHPAGGAHNGGGAGGATSGGSANGGASANGGTGTGGSTSTGGSANGGTSNGGAAGIDSSAGANDGGAAGAGEPPVVVIPDAIDLGATKFIDYGTLRIAFKSGVLAQDMKVQLVPTEGLLVTAVQQVDPKTVDVSLAYYHLPHDYQLHVLGQLADRTRFQTDATLSGSNNGSRIAFLTKKTGPGDLRSWTTPASDTPLHAADATCQAEAEAAGFKGTFVAFLSARGSYDAGCRAFGFSGLLANHCGQATQPADDKPWLSPNGLPIVNGATSIAASLWDTPVAYHADGTSDGYEHIWTGTLAGAKADTGTGTDYADCSSWTLNTGYAETATFTAQYLLQYGDSSSICDVAHGLMCLQVGGTFFGRGALYRVLGKRAFVSKGQLSGAMSFAGKTGIAAGDALCQAEATSAGYANAANFRAYLSTAATDAVCHVLGASGKAASQCGLAELPSAVWRRADDYPLANAAGLVSGNFRAPLSLATDQTQQLAVRPWTGLSGYPGSGSCADWTSADPASTAVVGTPRSTSYAWSGYSSAKCSSSAPLFCFEG